MKYMHFFIFKYINITAFLSCKFTYRYTYINISLHMYLYMYIYKVNYLCISIFHIYK